MHVEDVEVFLYTAKGRRRAPPPNRRTFLAAGAGAAGARAPAGRRPPGRRVLLKSKAAAAPKKSDTAEAGFSHEAVRAGPRPEGGRRPQPRRGRASACTCVHVYAPWHKAYDRPTTHLPSVLYSRVKLVEGFQSPCQYGISPEAVVRTTVACCLPPPMHCAHATPTHGVSRHHML